MKVKGKQLTEAECAALRVFIEDRDRGLAGLFVGRQAELDHVRACVRRLLRRQTGSAPGADLTTVIQGAPGAGKSALLDKIEAQWPLGAKGQPAAIQLGVDSLKLPMGELLANVAKESGGHPGIRRTLARFSSISFTVAGLANITFDTDAASLSSQTLTPIILLFDEIQSVLLGEISAQSREHLRENLRSLHTGKHNAPVFPVYGGLANSADLLRSAGLTRLASGSEWTLSGFSDDEIDELVQRFVQTYLSSVELDPAHLDEWREALRRDSQGWPMHTRHFLIALSEDILAKDGRPMAVDLDRVRRQITRLRCTYYEHRMQGPLRKKYILISRVLETMAPDGFMEEDRIIHALSKAHQGRPSDDLGRGALPDGMTAGETFGAMLHAGIVQKHNHLYFACPIPSLASYLAVMATYPPSALLIAVLDARLNRIEQIINGCQTNEEQARQLQASDVRGRTPLILAVEVGIMSVVQQLVVAEGQLPVELRSVGIRDHAGRTARDHANASGDERLVALIDQLPPPPRVGQYKN